MSDIADDIDTEYEGMIDLQRLLVEKAEAAIARANARGDEGNARTWTYLSGRHSAARRLLIEARGDRGLEIVAVETVMAEMQILRKHAFGQAKGQEGEDDDG